MARERSALSAIADPRTIRDNKRVTTSVVTIDTTGSEVLFN